MKLLTSLALGVGFGFLLHHGRVAEPANIVAQMQFRKFVMLKMFLSAVSTSLLVHAAVKLAAEKTFARARADNSPVRSYTSTAVGAALLGAGMTLTGSCPGTVMAQIGSGSLASGGAILAGGLCGALVYSLAEPSLRRWIQGKEKVDESTTPKAVDEELGVSYTKIVVPLAVAMAAGVYAIEKMVPWYTEVGLAAAPFTVQSVISGQTPLADVFSAPAWPPYLAGALIGLSQLPSLLLTNRAIGSSSSYVTCVGSCTAVLSPSTWQSSAYLQSKSSGWAQVLYMLGAAAGAYAGASLSGDFGAVAAASPPTILSLTTAFLGGAVLLFGARTADGCTSGHGISGFSQLVKTSVVAVPAMFGGGMLTAAIGTQLGWF